MNNLNNNAEDRFVVSDKDIKWGINGQRKRKLIGTWQKNEKNYKKFLLINI